jgi:hypothetical protein
MNGPSNGSGTTVASDAKVQTPDDLATMMNCPVAAEAQVGLGHANGNPVWGRKGHEAPLHQVGLRALIPWKRNCLGGQ